MMMNHFWNIILKHHQLIVTYNKRKIASALLTAFLLFITCTDIQVLAAQTGYLEYDDIIFDYTKLDRNQLRYEADFYFKNYETSQDKNEKEKFKHTAMGKYYLLTIIPPLEITPFVQLARLYDADNKSRLAKEYFYKATNIEVNNPFANYYFGEYYYKRCDYKRALNYYTIAYKNGYNNVYDLNLRLGTIYEKFADLVNAKRFYEISYSLNPQNTELQEKIHSLNELNYEKSEYYHFIRE